MSQGRFRDAFQEAPTDQYQLEVRQSVAETERTQARGGRDGSRIGLVVWRDGHGPWRFGGRRGDRHQCFESGPPSERGSGQALKSAAPSRGTLAQLALDDPEKYQQLTAQAESLRARGVRSLEEANQFCFRDAVGGCWRRNRDFRSGEAGRTDARPVEHDRQRGGIRESFGQAGRIVSRPYQSLARRFGELAREGGGTAPCGAGKAGVAARQQGITVDELLAATSIMATAKGTADEGGSRLNALLSALAVTEPQPIDARPSAQKDSPIKNRSEVARFADIAGDEAIGQCRPPNCRKVLGSREAVEAFGVLREQAGQAPRLADDASRARRPREQARARDRDRRGRPASHGGRQPASPAGAQEVERLNRGQASLEVDAMLIRAQRQVEQAPQASLLRRLFNATPIGIGIER